MSIIAGFIGGMISGTISWFVTNYYGRNLQRFWDLRREIEVALRAPNDCARLSDLASELHGLNAVTPYPISLVRHICGYNLRSAVDALESFSDLQGNDKYEIADLRVQVQNFLRLPVDPTDRQLAGVIRRINGREGLS
jgi:hypothetical protein